MKKFILKYKFIIILLISLLVIAGSIILKKNFSILTLGNKEYTVIENDENLNKIIVKGKIECDDTTKLYTTVSNTVKEVNVKVGDEVKKGDVIAILDSKDLESQIKEDEEALRIKKLNNENNLQKAKNSYNDMLRLSDEDYNSEIIAAKSKMDSAQLDLEDKTKTYNNNVILFEQGGLTQKELSDSEITLENAKNCYNDACVNLNNLKDNLKSKLKEAELAYKEAEIAYQDKTKDIQLEEKKKKLQECKIISPIDGIVSGVNISVGQVPSGTLCEIDSFDNLVAAIDVKEIYIDKVQLGQAVSMSIDSLNNQKIEGEVIKIQKISNDDLAGESYNSDDKSAEFQVRIKMNNINHIRDQLKIGMKVKADIVLDADNQIYEIPSESIIAEDGEEFILVAEKQDNNTYCINKMQIEKDREEDVQTQIKIKDIGGEIIILNKPLNYSVGEIIKIKR